jgi:inorganic pyrophosphatase
MPRKKGSLADPTKLVAFEDRKNAVVQVVIETPKGSRNKFAFDADQHVFILKKVLPEGMVFPHDFGFIPSTRAEDGDPIDVLILMDEPAYPGCVVPARLVGVIEGEQSKKGKTERNDRLLAVAESSHTHSDVKSIKDLNDAFLDELEMFFENYHSNDGEKFKVLACKGPGTAAKCLEQARRKAA